MLLENSFIDTYQYNMLVFSIIIFGENLTVQRTGIVSEQSKSPINCVKLYTSIYKAF